MGKILRNFLSSFINNLKNIITALIIAVVIWFAASFQIFPDVFKNIHNIPIQIVPTQLMVNENLKLSDETYETSVQIQGKRYEIGSLSGNDFEAYLDLSNITNKGVHEVSVIVNPLDEEKCTILTENNTIFVKVEKIATKNLEIDVSLDSIQSLDVVEGMDIDTVNLTCEPAIITITGDQDIIDSISRAEVITSNVGELYTTTELKGELKLYNSNNIEVESSDIFIDQNNFKILVPIHKIRTLPLDFEITGFPSNFDIIGFREKLNIDPKELTISSPNDSVDSLSSLSVGTIALNDLTYRDLVNIYRGTIAPWLPDGYKNISGNASYSLKFSDTDDYSTKNITLSSDNFSIINPPSNFDIRILTNELIVNVVGPTRFIQALSVDDISITINLIGLEINEGNITVNVSYRINGANVPAWVTGYPQVNLQFTAIG